MRPDTVRTPARLLVVLGVVIVTAVVLFIWGIGFTSGLIELVVFVAGLIAWALASSGDRSGEARAESIYSGDGSVRMRQRAPSTLARRIFARGDITIDQEDSKRH